MTSPRTSASVCRLCHGGDASVATASSKETANTETPVILPAMAPRNSPIWRRSTTPSTRMVTGQAR
jgi:hypothetical protein